jgi:hypothetical protein
VFFDFFYGLLGLIITGVAATSNPRIFAALFIGC